VLHRSLLLDAASLERCEFEMANPTLYASREGALYQSYDNYAGGMGFYDPPQDVAGPTMMANVSVDARDPVAFAYLVRRHLAREIRAWFVWNEAWNPSERMLPTLLWASVRNLDLHFICAWGGLPILPPETSVPTGATSTASAGGFRTVLSRAAGLPAYQHAGVCTPTGTCLSLTR
jgi:hypothetical protein